MVFATAVGGCALRTVPPIRYVPLVGAEKQIATTQVLERALRDRDPAVRAQAVQLLGTLSQSGSNPVKKEAARVLGVAARDTDPGIRVLAVEMLGAVEQRYGNKYLMAALRDPNPFVRNKVLEVLAKREAPPPPQPATQPPAGQQQAAP